jgi:hypothetical protein
LAALPTTLTLKPAARSSFVALDRDSHTTSGTETVGLIVPLETKRAMVEPGAAVFGE